MQPLLCRKADRPLMPAPLTFWHAAWHLSVVWHMASHSLSLPADVYICWRFHHSCTLRAVWPQAALTCRDTRATDLLQTHSEHLNCSGTLQAGTVLGPSHGAHQSMHPYTTTSPVRPCRPTPGGCTTPRQASCWPTLCTQSQRQCGKPTARWLRRCSSAWGQHLQCRGGTSGPSATTR